MKGKLYHFPSEINKLSDMFDWVLRYYKAGRVKNLIIALTIDDPDDPDSDTDMKYSVYWETQNVIFAQGLLHQILRKMDVRMNEEEDMDVELHDKSPEED